MIPRARANKTIMLPQWWGWGNMQTTCCYCAVAKETQDHVVCQKKISYLLGLSNDLSEIKLFSLLFPCKHFCGVLDRWLLII